MCDPCRIKGNWAISFSQNFLLELELQLESRPKRKRVSLILKNELFRLANRQQRCNLSIPMLHNVHYPCKINKHSKENVQICSSQNCSRQGLKI
jgi:hypothetical protein